MREEAVTGGDGKVPPEAGPDESERPERAEDAGVRFIRIHQAAEDHGFDRFIKQARAKLAADQLEDLRMTHELQVCILKHLADRPPARPMRVDVKSAFSEFRVNVGGLRLRPGPGEEPAAGARRALEELLAMVSHGLGLPPDAQVNKTIRAKAQEFRDKHLDLLPED